MKRKRPISGKTRRCALTNFLLFPQVAAATQFPHKDARNTWNVRNISHDSACGIRGGADEVFRPPPPPPRRNQQLPPSSHRQPRGLSPSQAMQAEPEGNYPPAIPEFQPPFPPRSEFAPQSSPLRYDPPGFIPPPPPRPKTTTLAAERFRAPPPPPPREPPVASQPQLNPWKQTFIPPPPPPRLLKSTSSASQQKQQSLATINGTNHSKPPNNRENSVEQDYNLVDDDEINEEDEFILFEANLDVDSDYEDIDDKTVDSPVPQPDIQKKRQPSSDCEDPLLHLSIQEVFNAIQRYNIEAIEANIDTKALMPIWTILSSLLFPATTNECSLSTRVAAAALADRSQAYVHASTVLQFLPHVTRHGNRIDASVFEILSRLQLINVLRFVPKIQRKTRRVKRRMTRKRRVPRKTKLSDLDGDYEIDDDDFDSLIEEVRLPAFYEEEYSDTEEVEEVYWERSAVETTMPRQLGIRRARSVSRILQKSTSRKSAPVFQNLEWDFDMTEGEEQLGINEARLLDASSETVWHDLENIDNIRNADDTSTDYYDYGVDALFEYGDDCLSTDALSDYDDSLIADRECYSDAMLADLSSSDDYDDSREYSTADPISSSSFGPESTSPPPKLSRSLLGSLFLRMFWGKRRESSDDDPKAVISDCLKSDEPTIELTFFPTSDPLEGDHQEDPAPVNTVDEEVTTNLQSVDWGLVGVSNSRLRRMGKKLSQFWSMFQRTNKEEIELVDNDVPPTEELTVNDDFIMNLGESAVDHINDGRKPPPLPPIDIPQYPSETF